ncbi:MarR family winged helix-turn-helix transcriptional regulator [Acidimangrovimonas sediminis]|uniref:MarR family winged helix-turn-helix transcriptional regulator n=1 Tax=Acidimangrovimonas sediminis TaxID=2056283 RepID=UPI000C7FBF06|nr:MarR family transcriptional regulator [Acidimangrovimonas sediminis]
MPFEMDQERDLTDRGIEMWAREVPELDTSGKAVTGRLLMLGEMVFERMNETTTKFGLKYTTYAIIATLRVSGPPYRLSPKALQATLLITSGGLSNLLARTEKQGLIRRMTDPEDGRGVVVELTEEGLRTATEVMPVQAEAERNLTRMFSEDERQLLIDLLRRMILINSIG